MSQDEDDFAGQEFNADETEEQEVEEQVEETEEVETVEEETTEEDSGSEQDFDKPVSEGDIVEVEIDDLGSKGDGIARVEGFVVFVPGAEVDQTYDVEVTSVGNKFAFAEIVE